MRIISKFTDYYDCGQSYGIDPNLIYFRTPQRLVFGPSHESHSTVIEAYSSVPKCQEIDEYWPILLGFCGKLFRVFLWAEDSSEDDAWRHLHSDPRRLIWSEELNFDKLDIYTSGLAVARIRTRVDERAYPPGLLKHARTWLDEIDRQKSFREWCRKGNVRFHYTVRRSDWEELTKPTTHPSFLNLFHLIGAPVFIMHKASFSDTVQVMTNIPLKDTGFIQFFDPFTAYQEIAMFLGGVVALPKENPPLTVGNDRIIAHQKGFDDQSFRGPNKGEAEERRRANRLRKRGLET